MTMVHRLKFNLSFIRTALLLLLSNASQLPAQIKEVNIVRSDPAGAVIEYVPAYHPPRKITANGNEFTVYDFENCAADEKQRAGFPGTKSRSIVLEFPGVKNNTVEIMDADYEEIPNVLLLPSPAIQRGEMGVSPLYAIDSAAYNYPGYSPSVIAVLTDIGETRGTFLGELRITPLQYDASRRSLRKYKRIVARVNFGQPEIPVKQTEKIKNIGLNELFSAGKTETSPGRKGAIRNSVLNDGIWYRFNVTEDGIYKITGQMLLNAGIPQTVNPNTIKIFGNGGNEVPMPVDSPYVDDLLENAVMLSDGEPAGRLDASDYIVFYGKGTKGWKYNPSAKSFTHYINHFTDQSVYWLTYDGGDAKIMQETPPVENPSPYRPNNAQGKLFSDRDVVNVFSSGIEWLGESFNPGGQLVYRNNLPGLDASKRIRYKFQMGAYSSSPSQFAVYEHDSLIHQINLSWGGDYVHIASSEISSLPNYSDGESRLRLRYTNSGSGGTGYLDWYEIYYQRFLKADNDIFSFSTEDTSADAEYAISGFSGGQVMLFDVTKFDSVKIIGGAAVSADTCRFRIALTSGGVRDIYAVGRGGFRTPGAMTRAQNQNLHGDPAEAEYIIVAHPEFLPAARRLGSYREQSSPNPLRTLVVDVNQIYNEFGGGAPTPVAVRNYLRYTYMNWSVPPKYVLLFGDGDFDYKRILGAANPNWIPPWESQESFSELYSYASDDPYGIFFPGNRVNIGIGRLTARTLQEAGLMVDKIIDYEKNPVNDPWKMRFTFVADDGPAGSGEWSNGFLHTEDAEEISKMVPKLFEKKKIYLYEYATVFTPSGRRKPDVNAAIQQAINQGTLVLNFTGHGNPRLWTHEAVFVKEEDFPKLHNEGKYFFLVAATCNYANFDALNNQSGGEILASMKDGGAIGVFSASRAVFADANFYLNKALYRYLLDTTDFGYIRHQRLGDIIYKTKQERNGDNDRKYFLLGDPALSLAFPRYFSSIDSINNLVNDQNVRLRALERASMTATVRDNEINLPQQFTGEAQVVVYDAGKMVRLEAPEISSSMEYMAAGSVLFRGQESVSGGEVNSAFIVPKDISYSDNPGRITLYFWNDTADGSGYATVFINGTDSSARTDTVGPQIGLFIDRRSFRPGDVVSSSPLLIADLSDSSGINTSGASIGHRLEVWLDDRSESIDVSDYYKSKLDAFDNGVIEYRLSKLPAGTHKLRMRAWDTYNNPSMQETIFDVETGVGLKLSNVFNYPNPFSRSTFFTFEHNQISGLDVEVKVYTIAGRLLKSMKQTNINDRIVRIPWDGRDKEGDELANGVYLYKIIAKTNDGRFSSETLGKLSVLK